MLGVKALFADRTKYLFLKFVNTLGNTPYFCGMIQLGVVNRLRVNRSMPQGLYLIALTGDEEVLLPNRYVTTEMGIEQEVDVFVYTDSEDRVVATTQTPKIKLNEFAYLKVVGVSAFGAFLDWGLEKDLFVPFRNQISKMEEGKSYIVYLYEDLDSDRLVGTTKYGEYLESTVEDLAVGDEVDLMVEAQSDLGVKMIVNGKYKGLVYTSELFKRLQQGMQTTGYVKKVREDGKLDISLEPLGHLSIEPNAEKLLSILKMNKGRLNITDKSDPELIKSFLQMSKKNFKKALGTLYKQRLVNLHDDYIELVENGKKE